MSSVILDAIWLSAPACVANGYGTMGIVKTRNDVGQVKFYIGHGQGCAELDDAQYIAAHGAKLDPKIITDFLKEV